MPDPLVFSMCMESMRTRKFLSKPMSIYYEVFLLTTNQRFKLPLSSVASVFATVIKLPATMSILSHQFKFIVHTPIPVSLPPFDKPLKSTAWTCSQKPLKLSCSSTGSDEVRVPDWFDRLNSMILPETWKLLNGFMWIPQDYLIDAPVEIGDGFSFSGGMCYSVSFQLLIFLFVIFKHVGLCLFTSTFLKNPNIRSWM